MESSTREYSNTPEHEQHVGGGGGEAGGDFGGSGGDPNGADGGGGSVSGDSAGRNSGGSENGSILVGMNAADSSTQASPPRGRGGSRNDPTGATARDASTETRASSETTGSTTEVASNPTLDPPAPPFNSPQTMSLVDATEQMGSVNLHEADERLQAVPTGGSPPVSNAGDINQGKAHLRGRLRGDVSLLRQLFKPAPPKAVKRRRKVTREPVVATTTTEEAPSEHLHEHSTWLVVVMEDLERLMKRMAMAAEDEHKINPEKSVEEHYCENVAKVLKEGQIKFDAKYLE